MLVCVKRVAPALALAILLSTSISPYAQTDATKGTGSPVSQQGRSGVPGPKKYVTVTGEILDMGCFTFSGLRGPLHRDCALKCIMSGVPMGLITADSVVYVLTQNHDRAMAPGSFPPPDPYGLCRGWPSIQVEIAGYTWERKGLKMLEVRMASTAMLNGSDASPGWIRPRSRSASRDRPNCDRYDAK